MRTTIRLDPDLLQRAKALALKRGTTLTAIVEESLRFELARARQRRERVRLPVSEGGHGTLPGVDLDNSAALLDLMEKWNVPR
ncbi:MAG: ribbon-helix-helix protein, CopG family [Terriglobales bacterium]